MEVELPAEPESLPKRCRKCGQLIEPHGGEQLCSHCRLAYRLRNGEVWLRE